MTTYNTNPTADKPVCTMINYTIIPQSHSSITWNLCFHDGTAITALQVCKIKRILHKQQLLQIKIMVLWLIGNCNKDIVRMYTPVME